MPILNFKIIKFSVTPITVLFFQKYLYLFKYFNMYYVLTSLLEVPINYIA